VAEAVARARPARPDLIVHSLTAIGAINPRRCAGAASRSGTTDAVSRFIASLRIVGSLTVTPAILAVLGFGVWLVLDSDAWDFGRAWIICGIALLAAALFSAGRLSAGLQAMPAAPRTRETIARRSDIYAGCRGG